MTLLAGFQILLYRYTGQEDILVGSPIANRNRVETEDLIGFFVNTLVLRTNLSGNPSFRELLRKVRETTLEAYAHQDLPFEKLVEALQPERDLSRNPLFQVFFNMLNLPYNTIELPGLDVEILSPPEIGSKFDLTLYVKEQHEGIQLELLYNSDLFSQVRIAEILEQFHGLLSQIVQTPDEKITHFSLVTSEAEGCLPNLAKALESNWEGTVHQRFSQHARRVPERIAVTDKQDTWTYRELDARSNQLANYLREKGLQSQDIVAIYGERSAWLVWSLLGVLKAGGVFVILDPAYPVPTLIDRLRAAKPQGWIQLSADGELPADLETFVASLSCRYHVDFPAPTSITGRNLLMDYSIEAPEVAVGPDDLPMWLLHPVQRVNPKAFWAYTGHSLTFSSGIARRLVLMR